MSEQDPDDQTFFSKKINPQVADSRREFHSAAQTNPSLTSSGYSPQQNALEIITRPLIHPYIINRTLTQIIRQNQSST